MRPPELASHRALEPGSPQRGSFPERKSCSNQPPICRRSSIRGMPPQAARLRYVTDARPGIGAENQVRALPIPRADGSKLARKRALTRIKSLAIPPAWTEFLDLPFCGWTHSGDRSGRQGTQAIPLSSAVPRRSREHQVRTRRGFRSRLFPTIRAKGPRAHGAAGASPREVLATVVHLLESTLIRVGNDDYAKQNNSYGLTTLKTRHVAVDGNEVRFRFTGRAASSGRCG